MKKFCTIYLFLLQILTLHAQSYSLLSPNQKINLTVTLKDKIYYSVSCNNTPLIQKSYLQLSLENKVLGENPKLIKPATSVINETSMPVVPMKNKIVENKCNVLKLSFKNNYAVEFRAYDDGIAYRFITIKSKEVIVKNEDVHLQFADNYSAWLSPTTSFRTAYEILYKYKSVNALSKDTMSTLPVLVNANDKYKILISEADLFDYPHIFLKSSGNN
ncbi:MAG: glycoside hydrolase family 97 N-terminal domain-containing protein [Parafilimonas sp.]